MKLWQGRTEAELNERADAFNRSLPFDRKMLVKDIAGSIAHVSMLRSTEVLEKEDAIAIANALGDMLTEAKEGTLTLDPQAEDVHMAVEALLTERLGDVGKRMHTARSRNDQVALDLRLYLKEENEKLQVAVLQAIRAFIAVAKEHTDTIMPGYTHLQIAQPVTFAHHMMAYAQMFVRDLERLQECKQRTMYNPLGSGALAGTTYPINRHLTTQMMGLVAPTENSMDSVSDRDFVLELAGVLSILQMHLSRLCEELILFSSGEFGFVSMDDAFSTGSSIMPQKKNPDMAELIRGKTGRVYGNLMSLLTMMKGLPLSYNKDMQEDKEPIFDSVETVLTGLELLAPMLRTMQVHKKRMREAAALGYINATDCADYLTKKGIPFRDAYRITGEIVRYCAEQGISLEELPMEVYRNFSDQFEADVYEAIQIENSLNGRTTFGGPAKPAVEEQIARLEERIQVLEEVE